MQSELRYQKNMNEFVTDREAREKEWDEERKGERGRERERLVNQQGEALAACGANLELYQQLVLGLGARIGDGLGKKSGCVGQPALLKGMIIGRI